MSPVGVFVPLSDLEYVAGEVIPCGVKLFGDSTLSDGVRIPPPPGDGSRDPCRDPAREFDRDGFRDGIREPGRELGLSRAVTLIMRRLV